MGRPSSPAAGLRAASLGRVDGGPWGWPLLVVWMRGREGTRDPEPLCVTACAAGLDTV